MEFRDSLNKSAIQLQKNLDKRNFYFLIIFGYQYSYNFFSYNCKSEALFELFLILGRQTEDRTYSLKLDGKSGPKIVEEKPVFNKPKK